MLLLQLTFLCVAFGSVQAQGEECWARRISLKDRTFFFFFFFFLLPYKKLSYIVLSQRGTKQNKQGNAIGKKVNIIHIM